MTTPDDPNDAAARILAGQIDIPTIKTFLDWDERASGGPVMEKIAAWIVEDANRAPPPVYVAHAYHGDGSGRPALLITRDPDDVIEFVNTHAYENVLVYKITATDCELLTGDPLPE